MAEAPHARVAQSYDPETGVLTIRIPVDCVTMLEMTRDSIRGLRGVVGHTRPVYRIEAFPSGFREQQPVEILVTGAILEQLTEAWERRNGR